MPGSAKKSTRTKKTAAVSAKRKVGDDDDREGAKERKKRGRYNTKNAKRNKEEDLLIAEIAKKYSSEGDALVTLTDIRLQTIIDGAKSELNLEHTKNVEMHWSKLDRKVKWLYFGGKRPGGRLKSLEPKKKRIKKKPTGGYRGKDTDEGRLVAEIARKYTEERKLYPRLEKGRFEDMVAETIRQMGLEGIDLGTMQQLDHRVRFIYQRHKDPGMEVGAAQDKSLVDMIYSRYSATKLANGVDGRGLAKGTFDSIIEAVRLEQGLHPDPSRMRAIRQKVQARFTRENPNFEVANPNRLKIGELSEENKRRRETLLNEITARYLRTREEANKGTTMTKQGPRSLKMADGTIPRIIEECKNDLGIHDFDVNMSSIRGRIHRKSLFVSKVRKGSKEYDAIDVPLVATINSWLGEGIPVTRAQGLDLANQLIKGKKLDRDEHGNVILLDAQWFRNFCHRNKWKLVGEISGDQPTRNAVEVEKYKQRYGPSPEFNIVPKIQKPVSDAALMEEQHSPVMIGDLAVPGLAYLALPGMEDLPMEEI